MPYLRRRELLSGIGLFAGAPLLGALCRNMTPDALGQTLVRKRILFYFTEAGLGEDCYSDKLMPESFMPRGNPDGTINLGRGWAPLEPYRNEMIFLRDTYQPFNVFPHGLHYFLSAAQMVGIPPERFVSNSAMGPPAGISLDRLIGREIGKNDLHQSISLGGFGTPYYGGQSSDGPNQRASILTDPVRAYATLFGGGLPVSAGDPAATAAYLAERKSLFDVLRGDLSRINARLGAPERAKMEQYVDSIRRVETRLAALADPTRKTMCAKPAAPPTPDSRNANLEQVAASMLDMAVTALECGLTKVAMIGYNSASLGFLGGNYIGTHAMQHGSPPTGGSSFTLPVDEMHKRFYNWHATNVKTVRERLGAAREGNGTIMDSSIIAPWQTSGAWHHRGCMSQYAWIIGSAGGHFKNMNKYKRYTTPHSMSDVFVSVAKAMGVTPRNAAGTPDRFGDEQAPGREFISRPWQVFPTLVNTGPNPDLT